MAEDGGVPDVPDVIQIHNTPSKVSQSKSSYTEDGTDLHQQPTYRQQRSNSGMTTPEKPKRQNSALHILRHNDSSLEHYFVGPRDLDRHSKLPFFMRMHGSVLPKMIVPLLLIGIWAAVITVITKRVHNCKEMLYLQRS